MKFSFWEDTGEQKIASDFEMSDFAYEAEDIDEALAQLQDDLYGHEETRAFVYKTDYENTWWKLELYKPRSYAVAQHIPLKFAEVLSLFEAL